MSPSGALVITAMYRGEYYRRSYLFYTRREAMRAFRAYVKEQAR